MRGRSVAAKKQQSYLLKQAKVLQPLSGKVLRPFEGFPRCSTTIAVALGCMLLLASVTSASQTNRVPPNSRRANRINPFASTEVCAAPATLNPTNTLTIYHSPFHFFSELICNQCDNGKFYADRHSIQPEGRYRLQEQNKFTNTVRDEYFNVDHPKLSFVKMEISDKQAVNVLTHIRKMHRKLKQREITFKLFDYNCIDYTQGLYAAAGGSGYFTNQFGTDNLFGAAGAMAYYKHNNFRYDTLFKMISILFHDPLNVLLPEDYHDTMQPCLLYDAQRTKPYYHSTYTLFAPRLAFCKTTPTGEQILNGYTPALAPDCEVINGVSTYPKQGHSPELTPKERRMIQLDFIFKMMR